MRKLNSWTKNILKIAVVIILLIFFHYIKILLPFENLAVRILAPVQIQFYGIGNSINNYFKRIASSKDIYKENEELKLELNRLLVENSKLKIYNEENEIIKKEIEFLTSELPENRYLFAKIIGKSQENPQLIFINRGEKQGVKIGIPVIVENGILIGKIQEVAPDYSVFLLITDNKSLVAGIIQNESTTSKLIMGEHGLSMKMELIPQFEKINEKDIVITSGLESFIPKGLIIGKVEKIIANPNELFKSAIINPLISVDNITLVTLLIP